MAVIIAAIVFIYNLPRKWLTAERNTMTTVTCPYCGKEHEVNPASLLGKGKKKTLSPAALAARRANAKKAGRPPKASTTAPQK